jgi:cytosine/adenosine deaminase-related metal-dependent hydrolase
VTGLVNAHTHLYGALASHAFPPGTPVPRGLPAILDAIWWRLDRALDEAAIRAGARLYVAEALLAGTTVIVDHHESPSCIEGSLDVLAEACDTLGMPAVLCYGATERNGGPAEAARGLAECARFVRENRRPFVGGVVGLHASFTVSDDTIRTAGRLCRDLDVPLHVHLAEDLVDVEDARARGYEGPLERLIALDALPPGSILAHGVHLGADQVRRAGDRGAWLVQNPRSNAGNGVGYAAALAGGTRVALGTDGFAADMVQELDALARHALAAGEDPLVAARRLPAGAALAAQFFPQLEGELLAPGPGASVRDWATAAQGAARARLTLNGRPVVEQGRLLTADLDTLRTDAAREGARLAARLAGDHP